MKKPNDLYSNNILISRLPPIPSRLEIMQNQTRIAEIPKNFLEMENIVRLHYLMDLMTDFNIPSAESLRLSTSIDLMIRKRYQTQNPNSPTTWQYLYNSELNPKASIGPSCNSASLSGHAGVGKTSAVLHGLNYYPQIIKHDNFPNILGSHHQMVWQSIEVPGSGKLIDFVSQLRYQWDATCCTFLPEYKPRFLSDKVIKTSNSFEMFQEWTQVAKSHFLGILHIDEVQNFFDIAALKKRQSERNMSNIQMRVIEDKLLRNILALINTGLPILFSGTPDGIAALSTRFSTAQRISQFGHHELHRFESENDEEYLVFIRQLMKYQFVSKPITDLEQLAKLLLQLTAGIKRLIISLWIGAHRVVYEEDKDALTFNHFKVAENRQFKLARPAVRALLSGDTTQIRNHIDLIGML